MATRRDKRAHLNAEQQIAEIHDDLDEGAKQFVSLRKDIRALLVTSIMVLLAVIGTGMWSNL